MVASTALTFSDLTERLRHRTGNFSSGQATQYLVRSVQDAVRMLPLKHSWKYFQREFRIITSASVGHTITYTASNRQAVTTGVWPADAADGELHIESIPYPVESRDSDTQLTLAAPAYQSDFSGSATWARESYLIPNIQRIHTLWQQDSERPIGYLEPAHFTERKLAYESPGTPVAYSFTYNSLQGETDISFSPPPSLSSPYIMSADIAPLRPVVHQDFGIANGSDGGTTLTIVGAKSKWIGSIIRTAISNNNDTDARSEIAAGNYEWQAVITNVSGDTVTVDTALAGAHTNDVFLVSSLVDIDQDVMLSYLDALALAEWRKNGTQKELDVALAMAKQAYYEAVAADAKASKAQRSSGTPWHVTDIRYAEVSQ